MSSKLGRETEIQRGEVACVEPQCQTVKRVGYALGLLGSHDILYDSSQC